MFPLKRKVHWGAFCPTQVVDESFQPVAWPKCDISALLCGQWIKRKVPEKAHEKIELMENQRKLCLIIIINLSQPESGTAPVLAQNCADWAGRGRHRPVSSPLEIPKPCSAGKDWRTHCDQQCCPQLLMWPTVGEPERRHTSSTEKEAIGNDGWSD